MITWITRLLWVRRAKKAIAEGKTTTCAMCDTPIIPGDFVAVGENEKGDPVVVHAGYHFTLTGEDAICETGALGSAIWDGNQAVGTGESLLAKAARTGEGQYR